MEFNAKKKFKVKLHLFFITLLILPSLLFGRQNPDMEDPSGNGLQDREQVEVTGTVIDGEDRMPLQGAHISLTHLSDTTRVYHAAADSRGEFSVSVTPGRYQLRVTFVGYQPTVLEKPVEVDADEEETGVGTIAMIEGEMLEEVHVRAHRPGAVLRGDTLAYDAAAYRLNPDATTEDLVRRMAGIRVDDEEVTAEGEDVERVLVDGREFFGDDPTIALRNLPAEVVESVEVYDRMSDQAELTGFDDGERSKTINIVTRLDDRSSQFGRAYSGFGGEDRYQAGLTTNIFSDTRRISIIGMSNNINEQNFSREDIMAFTAGSARGGRDRGMGGGSSGGGRPPMGGSSGGMTHVRDFRVGPEPGENTTHALGVNYSDVWLDDKMEITGSYFFNLADNYTDQLTDREYLVDEYDNQIYFEDSESESDRMSHRMNMRLTYDIDEDNSLIFTPRATIQSSDSDEYTYAQNLLEQGDPLNMMETVYDSDLSGYNYSGRLVYRHRIDDEGRSLSTRLNANFNNNESLYYLDAINEYFTGEGDVPEETVISEFMDQKSDSETINSTLSSNVTYTEPLGERGRLQATYDISRSVNENERITNSFEEGTGSYTGFEPDLSSSLKSNYLTHRGSLGYSLRGEDYNLTLEMGYQHADLTADQQYPYEHEVDRDFQNFLPRATLRYSLGDRRNLRFTYRTSTSAPSVTQLQDVVDNSNPMLLSAGNPDLDHSYSHFFMTRYNSTNTEKATNFVALLFANFTDDYIGNSTIIARRDTTITSGYELPRGSQFSQPENLDGHANIRTHVDYGFPVGLIRSNLNLNAGVGYQRTPSMINDRRNIANNFNMSGGLSLTSNIGPNIDFVLSYRGTYNMVENSIRPEMDNNYYFHRGGATFSIMFLENWIVRNDLSHRMYAGLGEDYNQDYFLWNINLGRRFFENNQGELTLSVFDLLGQNDNVRRNVSDTYIEDYRTNEISRYFMLTFTYNLRQFNLQESGRSMEDRGRSREDRGRM